jgi:beta-glucosidase
VPERLTVAEQIVLTTGADYWSTASFPTAGLRSLRLADGPHGLRIQDDENPDHLGLGRSLPATCFPPAVALASSWDPALVREVGQALGREARSHGVDVVLGPGMNIKRSPLCGRNFEYFSEDPLLSGLLAAAMVDGLQSEGVAACLKHFAANNQETDRQRVSADIDERTLREIYLRNFQIVIREANPWSVMSAYNKINGVYASENRWLLTDLLRGEWDYDGVVVSDWGAVHDPVETVEAGTDLRMPGRPEDDRPRVAEAAGRLDHQALARVAQRLALLAERTTPDTHHAPVVDLDQHHQLTRRAAAESAVLLVNDGALPLNLQTTQRLAVVGELARTPRYQGAGSSAVNPTRVVSGHSGRCRRPRHPVDTHQERRSGHGRLYRRLDWTIRPHWAMSSSLCDRSAEE